VKDITLDREYSFKSQRLHAGTSPSIPFAENLFRKFQWNRDSIMLNAPEGSGVYGLFSALWIYIGEAENMRERLLEHLSGNNSCTTHYQPSGFAFELVSPTDRCRRQQELVKGLQPLCNGKALGFRTDR
jgi:hypothetical protein